MIKIFYFFNLKTTVFTVASLLFAGAYYQLPLFTSNQNTYFLQGIAHAGYGYLSSDWLANQTDNIPFFSFIVSLIYTYGKFWIFYVLFFGLTSVYAYCLSFIAHHLNPRKWELHQISIFLVVMILLHCFWIFKPYISLISEFFNLKLLTHLFTNGVAQQYILGPYLQPSAFGVFLIASIVFFLYRREFISIFCSTLAASIHPTYILHTGILTFAYLIALIDEKQIKKSVTVGILAIILISPILYYIVINFYPSSTNLLYEAQTILVEKRIPHHANPSIWLDRYTCISILILFFGIFTSYRKRRLFFIITVSTFTCIAFSFLQIMTNNKSLALLFPWRLSTWLIPVCSTIIFSTMIVKADNMIAKLMSLQFSKIYRVCTIYGAFAFLIGCSLVGITQTVCNIIISPNNKYMSYAKENASTGQRYLLPAVNSEKIEFEGFRLATGVPIFVDWKSHPYRASEVAQWFKRIHLAKAFYNAKKSKDAASAFTLIQKTESITHVIVKTQKKYLIDDLKVKSIYEGGEYIIAELMETEIIESYVSKNPSRLTNHNFLF